METHPYGWLSLVPSLIAIVLAIATRRVVISLFLGVFVGALITAEGHLGRAIDDTMERHLWNSLVDPNRLRVFAFTLCMGAMVGVIDRAGGMAGLVRAVSRWAYNRRRGQLATWFLGMVVFFDDYANTVLLGSTLKPLCSRLRISREKLAYLVDSTAAPVAGLAIVSTWVAGEIDFIQGGLDSIQAQADGIGAFELFLLSIPYRFYVVWALVFVFLVSLLQRDFGPMFAAEVRATNELDRSSSEAPSAEQVQVTSWSNAVVPIVVTVVAVCGLLYRTGVRSLSGSIEGIDPTLWQIIGNSDSYYALVWGSVAGLLCSIAIVRMRRLLTWNEVQDASKSGAQLMLPALVVLWLAATLSTLTGHDSLDGTASAASAGSFPARDYRLYTGEYLAGLLTTDPGASKGGDLGPWMPTIVFLLSAGMSFATGTSWGTMAIVMPIAIPLAYASVQVSVPPEWHHHPVVLGTVGSVLAGAIFGDHCSPISDTTVLSSQACGCDHAAHVWTQLPYAVTVGAVAVLCGTVPVGFGAPVWVLIGMGTIPLVVVLFLLGRRV